MNSRRAFTLVELLVVIAIMGLLAGLMLPAISADKDKARKTACLNNLRQISLGLRLYSDDAGGLLPGQQAGPTLSGLTSALSCYRPLITSYVGLKGEPSPQDKLFACPADTFYYDLRPKGSIWDPYLVHASQCQQTNLEYSSYAFNGGIAPSLSLSTNLMGLGGRNLSSIRVPDRTVFVAEVPAFFPYSWHDPGKPSAFGSVLFAHGALLFEDARNVISFVDGHASYIKIYWNPGPIQPGVWSMTYQYNPPAGYDYKWSAE